jgi:pyruvate dehydrogenase E1 component alpha subunit
MKKKKMKNVVLCFFGEGATSTGNWHEGLNFASVLQAPVIFICNNNSYAYSTPNSKQFAIKDVATRGASYGIPSDVVDGNNVLEIYESAKIAIDRARNGGGPTLIECKTFRMTGHSAHDDAGYVPANEFEEWFKRDPIVRYQNHLLSNRLINEKYIAELDKKIKEELDEAVQLAEKEPFPEPTECLKNVYDNGINDLIVGKIPFWRKESLDNTNLDKPREWGEYSTPSP